ncbi:MAG: DUF3276 family protein [Bacteroidetes bacterium]|nr:DUF3276 family protein [Bacteroidota bacterium]
MSDFKNYNGGEREDEVFSKKIKAGRRTYFFDVKTTKNDDYYLTITESRKKQNKEGEFVFEKCKLFLYKEDFIKFNDGLSSAIDFIKTQKPGSYEISHDIEEPELKSTVDIDFDSL